jgi:hypothetical protein
MRKLAVRRILAASSLGAIGLLTAILADFAQAAEFTIESKAALLATLTGQQEGTGSLSVPGRNLKITCKSSEVTAGEIVSPTQALAQLTFLECTSLNLSTGGEIPACTVDTPIVVIAIFLPKELGKVYYLLKEQEKVEVPFTTVTVLGAECPIKGAYMITGSLVAQLTTNNAVVNLVTYSEAIQASYISLCEKDLSEHEVSLGNCNDRIKFGAFETFLNASATLELIGAHKGMKFGVA